MKKTVLSVCMIVASFAAGFEFNDWYYQNDQLYKSNMFKREYIQYLDNAAMKVDSIIDTHADDGCLDDFVDELWQSGYYDLKAKVDSMADTQI